MISRKNHNLTAPNRGLIAPNQLCVTSVQTEGGEPVFKNRHLEIV